MERRTTMRLITRVIVPLMMISTWILLSALASQVDTGIDFFRFWIIAGMPFGIRRMCIWLIPGNFGIAGSVGVLALNCIIGGLIGGVVLVAKILGVVAEAVRIMTGTYSTA